jgi:stage II sporulation protein D
MKKIIFLFFLPIFIFATHGSSRIEDSVKGRDTILRILTHEDLNGALIEFKGAFSVKDPMTNKNLSSSYFKKRFYLSTSSQGIHWGKLYKGIHQIEIGAKDPNTTFLIDGIQYKGKLTAFDIASKICLVVETPVDHYLKSILSGNFSEKNMHQTTLEALAIAIRTDIYHKIAKSINPFWDIKAEEHNFFGSSTLMINSSADSAVDATKDLIMLYNNRPFPTSWTEDCAGKTASYKTIFRKDADSPPGTFAPFAQKKRADSRWKCSISKKEFANLLGLEVIESIEPFKDSSTDKTYGLRILGKNLTFRELTFIDLQTLLGKTRLQSNDFAIELIEERIEFTGYGKGHGVGICLLSAEEIASSGKSTAKLLSEFFPQTKIIKLAFVPRVFFDDNPIEEDTALED